MRDWWRSVWCVVAACGLFAALWDVLFWGHPLGVSAVVFAGALTGVMTLRAPWLWKTVHGRVALALAGLALLALLEDISTLSLVMICVCVGTLALVSQRAFSPLRQNVSAWAVCWLGLLGSLVARLLLDNVLVARWLLRHPRLGGRITQLAKSVAWWVLPLIAGLFFAGLFAMANPVIERFFSHLADYLNECLDWLLKLSFLRLFMWVVVALLTYGILRYRRGRRTQTVAVPPVVRSATNSWLTGPEMTLRLLVVLNVVFAVENVLDAAYLYGGVPLPKDMTYTSYAHRGAYTLIATALLAGAFTLAAFRHNGAAQRSKACRGLVYAWIVQNILLLVSTVARVWVYVDTSLLTRWRMATWIWCALVAAGFGWIILRIMQQRTNAWLWRMNALTTFGVLLGCAFINFDGMIADFNVRHCAQSGGHGTPLDMGYLRHLGTPALPAVQWVRAHNAPFAFKERGEIDALVAELQGRLLTQLADWRGWTYRRWRTAGAQMPEQLAAR
jgi:hypothetical protein